MFINMNNALSEAVSLDILTESLSDIQNATNALNESIVSNSLLSESKELLLEGVGSRIKKVIDAIKEFFKKIGRMIKGLFTKNKSVEAEVKETREQVKTEEKKAESKAKKENKTDEFEKRKKEFFSRTMKDFPTMKHLDKIADKCERKLNEMIGLTEKFLDSDMSVSVEFGDIAEKYGNELSTLRKSVEGLSEGIGRENLTYGEVYDKDQFELITKILNYTNTISDMVKLDKDAFAKFERKIKSSKLDDILEVLLTQRLSIFASSTKIAIIECRKLESIASQALDKNNLVINGYNNLLKSFNQAKTDEKYHRDASNWGKQHDFTRQQHEEMNRQHEEMNRQHQHDFTQQQHMNM